MLLPAVLIISTNILVDLQAVQAVHRINQETFSGIPTLSLNMY